MRLKMIRPKAQLFLNGKVSLLAFVITLGLSHLSYSQNLTPVANDDNLNLFTNSGANTIDVQGNDVDDSPLLVTSILTPPANGTALVLGGDSIVYTPDTNFCGVDSLVYQICDNGMPSLCDVATVIFVVSPVDSDGDGLNDVFESSADFDGDGVYNFLDVDSDNDGVSDLFEANVILSCNPNPTDSDGDGIPNYLDLDSDNDGLSDLVEGDAAAYDTDNDGIIDNLSAVDHNANGMPDVLESFVDRDFDGDGIPDRLDLDSDNDGMADVLESGFSLFDTNGDGIINTSDTNGADSDSDGISNACDGFVGAGDGVGGQDEVLLDPDGDNLINSNDLDSDNDAVGDLVEFGITTLDTNGDGVVDGTDSDNDGIINVASLDGNSSFGGDAGSQSLVGQNNDGDGVIDALDLDSDNDFISDIFENGFAAIDTNNDGVADGADTDGDGIMNVAPIDTNLVYGATPFTQIITLFDADLDNSINSEDLDSDNDGIGDLIELGQGIFDANNDGVMEGVDTDNDGFINNYALDDNNVFGGRPGAQNENSNDVDGDLIFDFWDLESDGDTIPDVFEGGSGALDLNEDGRVDGTDTDGDGIINASPLDSNSTFGFSAGTQNETSNPYMDADGDTRINSEDLDSDNDALSDAYEWNSNFDNTYNDDCDANGTPDYLDPLSCFLSIPDAFSPNGDNINDVFSIEGINVYPGNKFSVFNRWGVVVFEAADYNNDWNGTSMVLGGLGGENLPVGTYFYVLDLGNGSTPLSGFIYLNR